MTTVNCKLEHRDSHPALQPTKALCLMKRYVVPLWKGDPLILTLLCFPPFSFFSPLTAHIHFSSRQHKCVIIISSKCKFPFYEKCQESLVVWINLGPELFEGKLWNVQRKCKFFFVAAQKFTQRLTWAFTFEGRITKW